MVFVWNFEERRDVCAHVCVSARESLFVHSQRRLCQGGASHAANGGDVEMTGWPWLAAEAGDVLIES